LFSHLFSQKPLESEGHKYGELSNLDTIKEGARVEINPEKKDPRDFALWKFSKSEEQRHMEWDSPWGKGFPGWHIECSAMSMKYLGETLDIHIGGEDLKSTHHPNEIAQSEAATGKKFVNYWVHGAFLQVDGGRMGKSLGNAYSLADLVELKYDPMHLRYFYFSGHYKKQLNFTFASLDAAKTTYERLKNKVRELMKDANVIIDSPKKNSDGGWSINEEFKSKFIAAIEDDLNMPEAIAIMWELVKSELSPESKLTTLLDFDKVLGLRIEEMMDEPHNLTEEYSDEVKNLIEQRNKARDQKDWKSADEIRDRLKSEFGVEVKDR
jgi:cysteinyl-tRNA synthetase